MTEVPSERMTESVTEAIAAAVEKEQWSTVVEECERAEAEGRGESYALLLLSHLLLDDLPCARLVWERAPEAGKASNGVLAQAWEVGRHMWRREHSKAHVAATALLQTSDAQTAATVVVLVREYRERTFALLSVAYANISLSQCASYLGLSYADCRSYVTARGWECQAGDGEEVLVVRQQEKPKQQTVGLEQLRQLVEYSVFLES